MKLIVIKRSVLLLVFIANSVFGRAASVFLQPVADTTLIEYAPDNNHGGTMFFNAGATGGMANGARNRGLIRFDLSSIPLNSKIKTASLKLEVTRAPAGAGGAPFVLHRMLRSWGEGSKDTTDGSSRGLGFPATTNEATWNSPFAFSTNTWSAPGADGDFELAVSSQVIVYPNFFPVFGSTPQLVADIELWLQNSNFNFGWMLKTEDEDVFSTARSFGSREFAGIDTNSPPYLEINFVVPPGISQTQVQGGLFQFSFLAEAEQSYVVEFKNVLIATNAWQALTNISAPTHAANVVITDAVSTTTKFYRVVAP